MGYFYSIKEKKQEIIVTSIIVFLLVLGSAFMFLYNRYVIYVKNMEIATINLRNHLQYTYRDKYYGDINVDYDVTSNTYVSMVEFYMPNNEYDFILSSKGHVLGDGYLHSNKDNLLSSRFARQLRESLEVDLIKDIPEIFKIYTEVQVLNGVYEKDTMYSKSILEPHFVHIYMTSKGMMSEKKFLEKVDQIAKILLEKGYTNLNNINVNYLVRKEAPPLYYASINLQEYSKNKKAGN